MFAKSRTPRVNGWKMKNLSISTGTRMIEIGAGTPGGIMFLR